MPKPTNVSAANRVRRVQDPNSYQHVIVICIILFASVVCFMLGILLGRWLQSNEMYAAGTVPARTASVAEDVAPPVTPPKSAATSSQPPVQEGSGEGTQAYPRHVTLPAAEANAPADQTSQGAPPEIQLPSMAATPATPALPPPATEETPAATTPDAAPAVATATEAAKPPEAAAAATTTPENAAPATTTPKEAAPAAKAPEKAAAAATAPPVAAVATSAGMTADEPIVLPSDSDVPPKPGKAGAPSGAPATAAKAVAEPALPAGSPGNGKYGIQVASLLGANRQQAAEEYARRVKAQLGLDAVLIPCESPPCVRVLVGSYPTQTAASEACNLLRKRPGFDKCFVKPLR